MDTPLPQLPEAPKPPGMIRRFMNSYPVVVDSIIVAGYLFGCALMAIVDLFSMGTRDAMIQLPPDPLFGISPLYPAPTLMMWVLIMPVKSAAVALSLFFRRQTPLVGLTVVALVVMIMPFSAAQIVADVVALVFALYAVPVYRSTAQGWVGYAIAITALVGNSVLINEFSPDGVMQMATILLVVLLVAINLGNRRRYVSALVERAEMLERDRGNLARISVARERERISREMHDIIAHSVSVMVALSEGAARAIGHTPDRAQDAMHRSAETGRTALAQMRRLTTGLARDDGAGQALELGPQPGAQNLDECVEQFREAGVEVTLEIRGETATDEAFSLTVYRVIQEALTNVLRYAGIGAVAQVTIDYGLPNTVIRVRDFGRMPGRIVQDQVGSGTGLRGLSERIRLFGGTMRAGNAPDRGWLVEAILPTPVMKEQEPS